MEYFIVSWHASGYTGTFNFLVVEESLEKAKESWEYFAAANSDVTYSWEKAKKAVENHYGGYIKWTEADPCTAYGFKTVQELSKGCYELEYDSWNTGSDHLYD